MTNEKMEQRLAAALEKTAPDDVSGVLSRCEARKGTVINMETKKTTKRRWTSLIAACLAVMLLGGGLFYQRANAVASVVSLDVNPSIELKVNRSEKVLVCTPLNEDAKAVLADMSNGADLKGAKLDVAVNAIVGSLVRNGYLDSISSAIMISVEDKDTARAEKLQRELTSAVDGVLQTSEAKAAVLTQTLTQDAAREQQARENSISTGKAALVNRVLALNATLKFDALAKLSVEELKDLAEAGAPAMPIGMDAARSAKRLGAEEVYIVYRRGMEELPARKEEVEHAEEEGIIFKTLNNPVEILGNDEGMVCGMKCVEMELGEPDESGRRRPVEKPDSEFVLDVDSVIMSIGTSPNPLIRSTTPGLEANNRGCLITKDESGLTTRDNVYAGGDAVTGAATVILAMGAGKAAAKAIDEALRG